MYIFYYIYINIFTLYNEISVLETLISKNATLPSPLTFVLGNFFFLVLIYSIKNLNFKKKKKKKKKKN